MKDKRRVALETILVSQGLYAKDAAEELVNSLNLFQVDEMTKELDQLSSDKNLADSLRSSLLNTARSKLSAISGTPIVERMVASELADESFPRIVNPDIQLEDLTKKLQNLSKVEAEDLAAKLMNLSSVKFDS